MQRIVEHHQICPQADGQLANLFLQPEDAGGRQRRHADDLVQRVNFVYNEIRMNGYWEAWRVPKGSDKPDDSYHHVIRNVLTDVEKTLHNMNGIDIDDFGETKAHDHMQKGFDNQQQIDAAALKAKGTSVITGKVSYYDAMDENDMPWNQGTIKMAGGLHSTDKEADFAKLSVFKATKEVLRTFSVKWNKAAPKTVVVENTIK